VPLVPRAKKEFHQMDKHRYTLEKGSKKHNCPDCNKKTFVLYIDIETGDYLPEQYGRCDRESKCAYHLNPYLDGYTKALRELNNNSSYKSDWKHSQIKRKQRTPPELIYFDFETFRQTLQPERYEKNTFIQNLFYRVQYPFDNESVTKCVELYRLGTIAKGYRAGAITFPFIDAKGNVRTIQVKQFDEANHTTGTDFLHSIIEKHCLRNNETIPEWLESYIKQDKRVSCLFGEHLLSKYPMNPVALVEAPKTAVYGTLYFGMPDSPENLIWLAVYNKSSFSLDKIKALEGRDIIVFPDLSKDGNTFREWETKAREYEKRLPDTRFIFSDLIEQLAPANDRNDGKDIADYLIQYDWRQFRKQDINKQSINPEPVVNAAKVIPTTTLIQQSDIERNSEISQFDIVRYSSENSRNWNSEIKDLSLYFENVELPIKPLKFKTCNTINDVRLFIDSHIETVKANNGNTTFLPYLNRLQELKNQLSNHNNS
jgi:hypothetical protein